jgi:DNA-binding CsgD family transcriptional regulator
VTVGTLEVVGREEELGVVFAFLGDVDRFPAALLIEGEAGIGKTTLWQAGVATAGESSVRVLAARPAESEMVLSFTVLGDLLADCLEEVLPELPGPLRGALEVALLLSEAGGLPPDKRRIGTAFLGAVRTLARSKPVLLAVDDLQWLDSPSEAVLQFALRRLRDEPVGLLLAQRSLGELPLGLDRGFPEDRVRRLRVGPLSLDAVHRLLRDRLGVAFPRPTLQQLHATSGGNPFFALELARALERRGRRLELGESLPGVDELVRDRLGALPAETLSLLSAAAALSQPTVALVTALGGDAEALEPAVRAHVIELDGDRVRFTHPLLGSAAYADVEAGARRVLHRRLAELVSDPEEKAHHLARSSTGADATVAAALDGATQRAATRGAPDVAAERAEQAQRLTPADAPDDAVRRTIEAAGHYFEAGDAARARTLLENAVAATRTGPLRAEALARLARAHIFEANARRGVALYKDAIAAADSEGAVRVDAQLGLALGLLRLCEDLPAAARHARAAAKLAEKRGDTWMQAQLLATLGVIEELLGRRRAADTMKQAAQLFESSAELAALPHAMFLRGLWDPSYMRAVFLTSTGKLDAARSGFEHSRRSAVELGDEGSLPWILKRLSHVELRAGDWAEAARRADEGYDVAQQTGQPILQAELCATRAYIHAHQGLVESTRREAKEALAMAAEMGSGQATMLSLSALGLLELSLLRPGEAHRHLGPLAERVEAAGIRNPEVRFFADEIEALIGLGRLADGEAMLKRLEERAPRALDRPSAIAAAGHCRGILCAAQGELAGARTAFDRALREHERVPMPFGQARTLLALGSTQRRARDRRGSRESLEQALALFEKLGAAIWAQRARTELARIPGRAPAEGQLTVAEQRVARLVAAGHTNKEVAAELVVTVRTVESTLTKVYAKLGVRSRTELARRIGAQESSTPS